MAIGKDAAQPQRPFEALLDQLGADDSPAAARGALAGAERLWPRACSPIAGVYFPGCAVERLYAESQNPPDAAATAEKPKPPNLKMRVLQIEAELATAKDLAELRRLRRRCALAAHPDLVRPPERAQAEKLMSEVNAAIDRAIKEKRFLQPNT